MAARYVAIVGATASGKSDLALRLAEARSGELINCDSVQLYKGFDIGAAKPSREERARVPHHLWDIAEWNEDYDARLYAEAAERKLQEIESRQHLPIVVGGTGLYLRALWKDAWHELPKDAALRLELDKRSTEQLYTELQNKDPARAAELHPNDRFRVLRAVEVAHLLGHSIKDLPPAVSARAEALLIRMQCPREVLHQRIAQRTRAMLAEGLIDEVETLLKAGVDPDCKPMQSIGYRQVAQFLRKELTQDELEEAIVIATRQYAKRQDTWFRKLPVDLEWQSGQSLDVLYAYLDRT